MLHFFSALQDAPPVASIIISIAFMLFFGFLMTRLTKLLKLPNVTAYILAGILIGPFCLKLVPERIIGGMDFLSDIALAFIAFSTGEFFRLSVLRKNGAQVVLITVLEACMARSSCSPRPTGCCTWSCRFPLCWRRWPRRRRRLRWS